jgi:hypothetical protein
VSMYTQLLGTALAELPAPETAGAAGASLAALRTCRSRMQCNERSRSRTGWAPAAVSDQLAYDIALVMLAVEHGIEIDVDGFERPQLGRRRLEQALAVQGILLDEAEEQPTSPGWR